MIKFEFPKVRDSLITVFQIKEYLDYQDSEYLQCVQIIIILVFVYLIL